MEIENLADCGQIQDYMSELTGGRSVRLTEALALKYLAYF